MRQVYSIATIEFLTRKNKRKYQLINQKAAPISRCIFSGVRIKERKNRARDQCANEAKP